MGTLGKHWKLSEASKTNVSNSILVTFKNGRVTHNKGKTKNDYEPLKTVSQKLTGIVRSDATKQKNRNAQVNRMKNPYYRERSRIGALTTAKQLAIDVTKLLDEDIVRPASKVAELDRNVLAIPEKKRWYKEGYVVHNKGKTKDNYEPLKRTSEKNKEKARLGILPVQSKEVKEKIRLARSRQKFSKVSKVEIRLFKELRKYIECVPQYPVYKKGFLAIIDIFIPSFNLCVCVDGVQWHNADEDVKETKILNSIGYNVVRFSDVEINKDIKSCVDKVLSLVN